MENKDFETKKLTHRVCILKHLFRSSQQSRNTYHINSKEEY